MKIEEWAVMNEEYDWRLRNEDWGIRNGEWGNWGMMTEE